VSETVSTESDAVTAPADNVVGGLTATASSIDAVLAPADEASTERETDGADVGDSRDTTGDAVGDAVGSGVDVTVSDTTTRAPDAELPTVDSPTAGASTPLAAEAEDDSSSEGPVNQGGSPAVPAATNDEVAAGVPAAAVNAQPEAVGGNDAGVDQEWGVRFGGAGALIVVLLAIGTYSFARLPGLSPKHRLIVSSSTNVLEPDAAWAKGLMFQDPLFTEHYDGVFLMPPLAASSSFALTSLLRTSLHNTSSVLSCGNPYTAPFLTTARLDSTPKSESYFICND
jgi:hypothetical protein